MKYADLIKLISKHEKGKALVKIGNIREIVSILSDLIIKHPEIIVLLTKNGLRRKQQRRKK